MKWREGQERERERGVRERGESISVRVTATLETRSTHASTHIAFLCIHRHNKQRRGPVCSSCIVYVEWMDACTGLLYIMFVYIHVHNMSYANAFLELDWNHVGEWACDPLPCVCTHSIRTVGQLNVLVCVADSPTQRDI